MKTETTLIRIYVKDHSDIMKEYHERRGKGEKIDVADIMAEKLKKAGGASS